MVDVKEFALKALDTAKKDLSEDKYLLPVAFIVTDSEVFDYNLSFQDSAQKREVYVKLVEIAKQKRARAIITLNDASLKSLVNSPPTSMSEEKTSSNNVQDCIYVTVSGPSIRTWAISVPYFKNAAEITFGAPKETFDDILNLLPDW